MIRIPVDSEKGFWRAALALALPIAFQNLLTSCGSLIDTAMIIGLGNAPTSAMGVASRFAFLLNVICFGFASGCATLLSQYWGAKDLDNLRRSAGLALSAALLFGLFYTACLALFPGACMQLFTSESLIRDLGADYLRIYAAAVPFVILSQILCAALRAVQHVAIPLLSSAAAVLVNTGLNYCLIFGNFGFPRLEMKGAALATAIGCAVQALVLIAAILFTGNPFRAKLSAFFSFSREFLRKYFRIAAPVLLNESLWAVGTNVYVMVYARQGIEAHAGYTLYENVQQLFFVFFVGICGACSVMVGMRVGAGDHEGAYRAARRFAVMTPLLGFLLGTALIAARMPLLSLFPLETEGARHVAADCLFFYGFWLFARMIPYILICGIFRAGGDTRTGCFLDMLGLYGFGIPTVLIFGLLIRPASFVVLLAAMFIAEDTVKGILCVRHFRSRRWIRQITAACDATPCHTQNAHEPIGTTN